MTALYSFCTRHSGRRMLVLLAALLFAAQTGLAASKPIYSAGAASVIQTCTTVVLVTTCFGSVDKKEQAADGDFNTAATIQVPFSLLGGSVKLRLNMEREAPKNYRAGVVVRRNGGLLGLLGLNLAGTLQLRTLKREGSISRVQETVTVSAKLAQAVLGEESDAVRLEFVASQPFDQIELEASSLLSLGYNLDVFYAYAIDANVVEKADGYVSRFSSPSAANYSTAVIDDNGLTICVNSGVTNPLNAVDEDLTNYATLNSLVGVSCPATLQTQLEGQAPAGYEAGFVLGSAGLLDVNVLDALRISTYRGGVKQEYANGRDLLRLQVLSGGQYVVRFTSTKPFDRVELQRTSLLSALDNVRLYYGFGLSPSVFYDANPRLSSFGDPATHYQVGGPAGMISNPQLAADDNLTTNYATVGSLVGLLTAPQLKLRLNGPGKAGNTAGVVLGLGTGLLDADVLRNVRIKTYSGANGGTLVETATGGELLNLELLAGGRREVSFLTTQDFDWVEVELATGVAVLSDSRIYYAFAEDRPTGFPTSIVKPTGPLPVQLTAFGARASSMGVEVTWETATETNSNYFEVERSVETGRDFVVIGRQQAAGSSTRGLHYSLIDATAAQLPAGVLYYRLHQVDLDGTESYSEVAVVRHQAEARQLVLYPNPNAAGGQLRISNLPEQVEGSYQLLLYSMQGTLVSQQPLRNVASAAEALIPNLGAGVYYAVVRDANGRLISRQRLVLTEGL